MKSQQVTNYFYSFFRENLSYKLLSLGIAIMLWFVVFNRKEFIVSWDLQVQTVLSADQSMLVQTADKVRVRMSGPRSLIKSFRDSSASKNVRIDLSRRGSGTFEVDIHQNMIDAPRGIKILSIRPNLIRMEVQSQLDTRENLPPLVPPNPEPEPESQPEAPAGP